MIFVSNGGTKQGLPSPSTWLTVPSKRCTASIASGEVARMCQPGRLAANNFGRKIGMKRQLQNPNMLKD
jgi:hypothetical protein